MVKKTIIFLAGVLIGGTAGFFSAKYYLSESIREEEAKKAQEDINHMKELYSSKDKKEEKEPEKNIDIQEKTYSVESIDKKKLSDITERLNYRKYASEDAPEKIVIKEKTEEIKEPEVNYIPERPGKKNLAERPYIIDEEDYRTTMTHMHSKEALFYDAEDDVLLDEEDIPVEDPNYLVGTDYIKELKSKDRVFVRNERAAADYEIIKRGEFND